MEAIIPSIHLLVGRIIVIPIHYRLWVLLLNEILLLSLLMEHPRWVHGMVANSCLRSKCLVAYHGRYEMGANELEDSVTRGLTESFH